MSKIKFALVSIILLAGCLSAQPPNANFVLSTASPMRYIANERAEIVNNQTISFRTILLKSGPQIKLVLSNEYGNLPIKIGGISIRFDNRFIALSSAGKREFEIPANGIIETDAVQINATNAAPIETRIYLKGENRLSSFHGDGAKPTQISVTGDYTNIPDFTAQKRINIRPFFAGYKVLDENKTPAIVTFGDSITDAECPIEQYPCNYSQVLFNRLQQANKNYRVLNMGISGNQILKDFYGVSAQKRFERDVLNIPNLKYLIILIGINDIGLSGATPSCPNCALAKTEEITSALGQFASMAQQKGVKVFISPLLPFEGANYYTPEKEQIRQSVNQWIKSNNGFEHGIDFEAAVAEEYQKSRMRTDFDRGDRLHPNIVGQKHMGNSIDIGVFE